MNINFSKSNGLIPVIVQDNTSSQVLMLGYMNAEAYEQTAETGKVTFYSRSKKRLWTKGESSGNFLAVNNMQLDCDQDTLLIKAEAVGPTCHTGTISCFGEETVPNFLYQLEQTISERINNNSPNSYTNKLFRSGLNKIAQKVGEEAVELVIEAKDSNPDLFKNEAADLLYHYLILLYAKGFTLKEIEEVLQDRTSKSGR